MSNGEQERACVCRISTDVFFQCICVNLQEPCIEAINSNLYIKKMCTVTVTE